MRDFQLLHQCRQASANGPQTLALSDINNMFFTSPQLRGTPYRKYLKYILALDNVYLTNYAERNKQ